LIGWLSSALKKPASFKPNSVTKAAVVKTNGRLVRALEAILAIDTSLGSIYGRLQTFFGICEGVRFLMVMMIVVSM
jgi:hypothetical protein